MTTDPRTPLSKVTVVTTGGTIASRVDETGAAVPLVSGDELIDLVPGLRALADVRVEPFKQVASWNLDVDALLSLSELVAGAAAGADGVVVTHGTDTLEETAWLLDLTVATDRPVVVAGAMRNNSELGADGPRNLRDAVRVAADPTAAGRGVLVVFNEQIHAARDVTKTHSSNLASFQSPWTGPVGAVDGAAVRFTRRGRAAGKLTPASLPTDVHLVKTTIGADDRLVRACLEMGASGLVVEGTGLGHVPGMWVPALRDAAAAGTPVVLTSRTFAGDLGAVYGGPGGGRELAAAGVIPSPLSGQKARLQLMVALGAGLRGDELRAWFAADQAPEQPPTAGG